ncbi:hypothetical protein PDIG_02340 [Penicillium digitatum PHI26]|uniref:Uncharacterized protein n=2 Tax=Penicillium digitatum TaxID=36651 RepID=K9GC67_PEND2|nr:hypothetical protein PDIP_13630 [Penicillium digitatum Pd1]EKV19540.1 hypothetical protein PDIG_02340 [Penicillium digitatum PHI26]EKV20716.1 hypothetical protein PDIP_13630 [Penicillium digitatum Pd1]
MRLLGLHCLCCRSLHKPITVDVIPRLMMRIVLAINCSHFYMELPN